MKTIKEFESENYIDFQMGLGEKKEKLIKDFIKKQAINEFAEQIKIGIANAEYQEDFDDIINHIKKQMLERK